MKILFAAAEFAPLVRVGGLGEACAGLVHALRSRGVDVEVVVPDYSGTFLDGETTTRLDVPSWAGPAVARSGVAPDAGKITLIDVPRITRDDPYTDANGRGWSDNPDRFFAFSAAVSALVAQRSPDVLHCNDWHTAAALGFLSEPVPSVLTIHTLGYQGWTSGGWLDRIPRHPELFEAHGGTNPMAGGIQLADRVIAVSPTYADEIRRVETGSGLHKLLVALRDRLIGIRNGIDTSVWDPSTDPAIAKTFDAKNPDGKQTCRSDLLEVVGWQETGAPIVGVVSRLVEQKGIETVLDSVRYADTMPFRLIVLGSGERQISDHAMDLSVGAPDTVFFHDGFDNALAHKIFAGADLLAMPSVFEPCGLSQMQAMEYGTIPVVNAVGGLRDTVTDADIDPSSGTGFVSASVDTAGFVDALHRAVRAWNQLDRRRVIQLNGMSADWSWQSPARRHIEVYEDIVDYV